MQHTVNLNELSKEISPLPLTVSKIIELLGQDDVSVEELSSLIMKDPGLSMRILGLANSPFYGLSGHVSSIKEACIVLGVYTLRNIAMASGIVSNFPSRSGASLDIGKLWQHAVGTGVAAKILAGHIGLDEDIAFTAGLLHDIGKIILDKYAMPYYMDVITYRDSVDCRLIDAESHILGITHVDAGLAAAEKWNLPKSISNVIQYHHSPPGNDVAGFTDVVHVADVVSRGLAIGNGGDTLMPKLDCLCMERINLDISSLSTMLGDIESVSSISVSLLVN